MKVQNFTSLSDLEYLKSILDDIGVSRPNESLVQHHTARLFAFIKTMQEKRNAEQRAAIDARRSYLLDTMQPVRIMFQSPPPDFLFKIPPDVQNRVRETLELQMRKHSENLAYELFSGKRHGGKNFANGWISSDDDDDLPTGYNVGNLRKSVNAATLEKMQRDLYSRFDARKNEASERLQDFILSITNERPKKEKATPPPVAKIRNGFRPGGMSHKNPFGIRKHKRKIK